MVTFRLATDIDAVISAAERIRPRAVHTPLIENPALNERAGRRVLMKAENLQRGGSFKFRGAYNRLARLSEAESAAGVVAWSSGNHAQGVAAAARLLGVKASIVMPFDAPAIKRERTLALGAEIISYDRYKEDREEIGRGLASERGAVLVPSYDDPDIIAGQGTVGLEIAQDATKLDAELGAVLVCCGGGGLSAGIATALAVRAPGARVFTVEPEAFDDTARSLLTGRRETNPADAHSMCDALLSPTPGALTFPILKAHDVRGLTVSEDEVRHAVRFAFEELKVVLEPGGAVSLAAVLAGKAPEGDAPVAVILSGGNVDAALFAEIIGG